jgi:5-(carboxyamino)imidazole ribonucleotide mutase
MNKVGVIMGSDSDLPVMREASEILLSFGIEVETTIVSAHRTPDRLVEYAKAAHSKGIVVIIAGAGGAAHLPGMVASFTHLPVIGVPVKSNAMSGIDSLYSIVQMPPGVPVATVAINGAKNAGILAAQIIGIHNKDISDKVVQYKKELELMVLEKANQLENLGIDAFLNKA